MYAQPTTAYGDITRYFSEQRILFYGKKRLRPTLVQMLRNPIYVQADLEVYKLFKNQETFTVNDAADFAGMNGYYLYLGRDVKPSKKNDLKDQMLVLAPHEGIVPTDVWLACRKKLINNMKIQSARKAAHTWLTGKIKCGILCECNDSGTGRVQAGTCKADSEVKCGYHQPGTGQPNFRLSRYIHTRIV